MPPSGAKFSCKTPMQGQRLGRHDLFVPEGTMCRLKCIDDDNSIPKNQFKPYFCWDGKWNATINRRIECL